MEIGLKTSSSIAIGPRTTKLGRYATTELELKLGRYVATELEPKLGRYIAIELSQNVETTRIYALSSTL
ncbi:hypothetical protein F2Q69_00015190 [Brassica cretica]|uniref:Uncharacterized protein n=1 Tax=Brassica cretica TaxID=69181 RepID=A0A8S9R474_BRACR|nr:hypothetical protein F2Q69_00015190 [Brassica cretica]